MFGWLFGSSDNDRRVFRYRDGSRRRSADPVEVERVLTEMLGEDWRSKRIDLSAPTPDGLIGAQVDDWRKKRETLRGEILAAIDAAFDVRPYKDDGGKFKPSGLTVSERIGLLDGYWQFTIDLARLARPFVRQPSRASPTTESRQSAKESGSISAESTSLESGRQSSPQPSQSPSAG